MKIKNVTARTISIGDLYYPGTSSNITLEAGQELVIYNEDAEKSTSLASLMAAAKITKLSSEEPLDSSGAADVVGVSLADVKADTDIASAISLKHDGSGDITIGDVKADTDIADAISLKHDASTQALKDTAAVEVDAVVTAVVDAPTQGVGYVQTDVQAIADLANDLKAKYNAAVALINELKGIVNAMNA